MSGHLPALSELKSLLGNAADGLAGALHRRGLPMFAPGMIVRSEGLPVDETLAALRDRFDSEIAAGEIQQATSTHGLASRIASISELTEDLYNRFAANPASIANWFPALARAVDASDSTMRLPATSIVRLPIEIAQYLRLDYTETNQVSRDTVNALIADHLHLQHDTTYFLKTGTFSSKFEFANAKCSEPEQAGEYFHVVTNAAMSLGAGDTVDLCAREYIEPAAGTPQIYHGMPLRTELRVFVDLGSAVGVGEHVQINEPALLGVTPYWHPSVMRRALALAEVQPGMQHIAGDYDTYTQHLHTLTDGFAARRDEVAAGITALIEPLRTQGLSGAWSVDVMVEGDDLWIIDAAPMRCSALTEQLLVTDEYALAGPALIKALSQELIIDHFDPRSTSMTPGFPGVTYRHQWQTDAGTKALSANPHSTTSLEETSPCTRTDIAEN